MVTKKEVAIWCDGGLAALGEIAKHSVVDLPSAGVTGGKTIQTMSMRRRRLDVTEDQ